MTRTRDEAFYAFGAATNDERIGQCYPELRRLGALPAPDAPLHEHLAFVGRVAEAIKARVIHIRKRDGDRGGDVAFRSPAKLHWQRAPDLCHAALLAALAALEAR